MQWLAEHPLTPMQIEFATAVMLKILDGKCKMHSREKAVMNALYDALKTRPRMLFDKRLHALVATARQPLEDRGRAAIYGRRGLADTTTSQPVMKAFKAMLNDEALLRGATVEAAMSSDRP
jgi:hypothetical protein